jgi:hypothetical protein
LVLLPKAVLPKVLLPKVVLPEVAALPALILAREHIS